MNSPKRIRLCKPDKTSKLTENNNQIRLKEFITEKGIALTEKMLGHYCTMFYLNLIYEKDEIGYFVGKIEYVDHTTHIIRWLAYNFNLFDVILDEESITISFNDYINWHIFRVYTVNTNPTESDFPFWCIEDDKLCYFEKFVKDDHFHLLRNVKTSKSLPINSIICYSAVVLNLSASLLESLFWSNTEPNQFPVEDGYRLLWNCN